MTNLAFSTPFQLNRSRHAAIQVFEHLRAMIITLNLTPGTVLSRSELANYFTLSQTPIRDALLRLEEEGLVDIFPQYATMVRAIDIRSARQAHFLRLSLELEVVHTLARDAQPALISALQSLLVQQRHALEIDDYDAFIRTDQMFHRQMFTAANAKDLWHLLRRNSGNIDRLRRLHVPIQGKAEAVLHDHADILAAIQAGDADLAQQCVRRHLSGTLAQLETIRARHPNYLLDDTASNAV